MKIVETDMRLVGASETDVLDTERNGSSKSAVKPHRYAKRRR